MTVVDYSIVFLKFLGLRSSRRGAVVSWQLPDLIGWLQL